MLARCRHCFKYDPSTNRRMSTQRRELLKMQHFVAASAVTLEELVTRDKVEFADQIADNAFDSQTNDVVRWLRPLRAGVAKRVTSALNRLQS